MKKIFIFLTSIGLLSSLQAQTIQLSFPHFAGKEYSYVITKGDRKDTIVAKGKLDSKGKTILQLPISQKGYVGMSSFQLTEGGVLDILVNNENCTISCNEAVPTLDNIKFIASPDNEFLVKQYQKQQQILEKVGVINGGLQVYTKNDSIYPYFEKEFTKLKQRFAAVQSETAHSKLYAARFREMNDFLMGVGSRLDLSEAERNLEFREFIAYKSEYGRTLHE